MPNTWSDPYAQTPAGPQYAPKKAANASEQVLGLYQQNFGRSASSPEIETWVNNAGGGAYLSPDQLSYVQTQFQKAPEYAQHTGQRPTLSAGDYIPGVTLGSSLASDEALRQRQPTIGDPLQVVGQAQPGAAVPNPLQGTTSGATALGNPGPASQETSTAGLQALMRDRLINLMETPTASMQDPALAAAGSAFGAAQNKATARQVNQNAEAFGAAGLESSGARLGADRAAIEQQGLNEGTFNSNLVLNQLESQRQQAQQGLQMALAMQDQDLSRRLQAQLGDLNAAVQRESLKQSGTLGQADIDLRQKLGYGNLNLGMLDLAQRGRIANDNLGFNLAQLESGLNNNALVRILTGA